MIGNEWSGRQNAVGVSLAESCSRRTSRSARRHYALTERRMVGRPCLSTPNVGRKVISVARSVPLLGPAPGNHLDLCASGIVKVSRLPESVDSELLDSFYRSRDDTRSHTVCLRAGGAGEIANVAARVARHVVRVVASINREGILVFHRAGDLAEGPYARL